MEKNKRSLKVIKLDGILGLNDQVWAGDVLKLLETTYSGLD